MALAIDASSPAFVANTVNTIATASFTPPVGSLLVVAVLGTSFSGNPNPALTSTGLTFVASVLSNVAGQSTVQFFTADVGANGGSARTVSVTVSGFASVGLKVWVITGQHATAYTGVTSSGNTTANAFNETITTDSASNWVLGAASDFNNLGTPTTTDVDDGDATGLSMSYLAVRKSAVTASAGAETLNVDGFGTSAAAWAWAAIAIRPASYVPPTPPTFSNLTANGASSATSFTTASVTPTGNRLILVSVHAYISTGSAAPSAPSVTGNGITYTQIGTGQDTDSAGTDRAKLFVFRGMAASPTAGAITISFGATTMTRCNWAVDQSDANVDTSGTNGSGAIVTSPPVGVTVASGTGTGNITYAPAMSVGSSGYAAIAHQTNEQTTPRSGWTELADTFPATLASLETQYIASTDTAASGTWTTSSRGGGIALEVKGSTSAGVTGTAAGTQAANTSSASGQLGYSGTSAATEIADTSSASGTVVNPVTGTAAPAQANQIATTSGQLGYSGTSAANQANQASSVTGQLGYSGSATAAQASQTGSASGQLGYSGTSARVQANQTSTTSGQLAYSGTSSATETADTSSASGTFTGSGFSGNAAVTQAPNTSSASGQLGYSGTAARVQANQTSTATGQLGYTGSAADSQAAQTSTASGQLVCTGTAATIQASQTAAASGTFTSPGSFTGSAAVTQAGQTSSASGQLGYSGASARTQANQTSAASGTVVNPVTGTASPVQAAQFSIANGILRYSATGTPLQAANISNGAGIVSGPISGTGACVQANQTVIAVGMFTGLVTSGTATAAVGAAASASAAAMTTAAASAGSMTVPTATGG